MRFLDMPTVRDRVVQATLKLLLEPTLIRIFRRTVTVYAPEEANTRRYKRQDIKIIDNLKNLITCKPQHYIGHNPAGGAMVVALLLSLAATTLTGLKLNAVEE